MRGIVPRRSREEDEESVFVSMTDMTISFLIILMILLAFFASRFTDDDMVPRLQLEELQVLVESLRETIALLSTRASITPAELAVLRRDLQEARQDLTAAQHAFEEERERLEAELSEAKQDLAVAQVRLARLEDELTSRENSLRAARSKIDALNETIRQLHEERAALRRDVQEARQDLTAAQHELEEERKRFEAELSDVRRDLTVAQVRLAWLEDELTSRENSLRAARSTIDSLNETIRQLQEELAHLRPLPDQVERLNHRIVELKRALEELRRPDPLEEYLRRVAQSRLIALRDLRNAIRQEFPNLHVVISAESDALRFQGEGLFESNARAFTAEKRRIVERISELLDGLLPCYSLGPRSAHETACNPGYAVIEAVQIEGHTDSRGSVNYNMGLASDRAVSTYLAMSEYVPGLLDHTNMDGEPVLSVAGYGETRPVARNNTAEGRSTNRRIDLRFIMYSPSRSEEIEIIRRQLAKGAITGTQP